MKREIPITMRQLQLFRDAEASAAAKTQAVRRELDMQVQLLGAGIVAGHEAIDEAATATLVEWRGDPPRLIIETDEPEPAPDTPPDDDFVREAIKNDSSRELATTDPAESRTQ